MIARAMASVLMTLIGCSAARAQAGFYLPAAPTSSGQDEFHASDGTSCRTTMDGTKRVEVGSYGTGGDQLSPSYAYGYPYGAGLGSRLPSQKSGGVYARFTMSLDASKSRMDCSKLYELELERRRLEIEIMKRNLVTSDQKLDELKRREPERDAAPARAVRASSGLRGSFPPL